MDCKIVGIVSDAKERHRQLLTQGDQNSKVINLGSCTIHTENCTEQTSQDGNFSMICTEADQLNFEEFITLYNEKKEKAFSTLKGNFFLIFYDKSINTQYFVRAKQCLMPFYWSEKKSSFFPIHSSFFFLANLLLKKLMHMPFVPTCI